MKLEKILKGIFLLTFDTRIEMNSTMLRFEEHYESPKFRGKIFTFEEYRKWYIKNSPRGKKTGKFTYNQDWAGFNVPSYALEPFYEGKFDPLSDAERGILALFRKFRGHDFYIITHYGKSAPEDMDHEIAHGLFYTNPSYRKEVLDVLKRVPPKAKMQIERYFKKYNGYHKSVWIDEMHAYILTSINHLKKRGVDVSRLGEVHDALQELFKKYYKG